MAIEFRVLGPLSVVRPDGSGVELGGPRQRAVLARLLAAGGEVVPAERIVDDLWRGEPPPRALGALQAYVSHLRRALEPDRPPRAPARLLVSAAPGYALAAERTAVDANAFTDDVRAAQDAADPAERLARAESALAHWRGPAYAEVAAEPWVQGEVVRLGELRARAQELRAQAMLDAGRDGEAAGELESLVSTEPLREERWRLLALALYRSGRQGDALGALRRARDVMRDELGVDPGAPLRELEQAILDQDPALRIGPPARDPGHTQAPAPAEVDPRTADASLVGRGAELSRLRNAADRAARDRRAQFVLVTGEAGIGKSALVTAFAEGRRTVWGRCPEADGAPPLWPWTEVVEALLPGAPLTADEQQIRDSLDEGSAERPASARFRLHRSLGGYLGRAAGSGLVVVLDDVHRADEETLALLRYLTEAPPAAELLVVATARPDEHADAVEQVADAVVRHGGERIALGGLEATDLSELVRDVCAAEGRAEAADETTVAALVTRTAGNPLYAREAARLLVSEGALVATSDVPAGVRDVVRRRLARLPATTQNVLRTVAMVGRSADIGLVVAVDEHDEDEVYDALEAAVVAGVLDEPDVGVVRFTHVLVRDTVLENVPRLRRAKRHAEIAAEIAARSPEDVSALAYHYGEAAGIGFEKEARHYALAAAAQATRRFAHATALDWWERALDLDARLGTDRAAGAERVTLLLGHARALQLAGRTRDARRARSVAAHEAREHGDPLLLVEALTSLDVPMLWGSRDYDSAEDDGTYELLTEALDLLPDGDSVERVRLLAAMADERVHGVDPDAALAHALDAEAMARRVDAPPVVLAIALNPLYNTNVRPGRYEHMATVARELSDIGRSEDLPGVEAVGLMGAGSAALVEGDAERAAVLVERADELARRYDLPAIGAQAVIARACLRAIGGDVPGAEHMLRELAASPTGSAMFDVQALTPAAILLYRRGSGAPVAPDEIAIAEAINARYERFGPGAAALTVALAGDPDRARRLLDADFDPLEDYMWLLFHALRGDAAAETGHVEAAKDAYAVLEPHEALVAGGETLSLAFQPVAITLARLATVLGDDEAAHRHWQRAHEVAVRAGAPAWEAAARTGLGL